MNDDLDYVYLAPDLVWRGAGPVQIQARSELDTVPPLQMGSVELPAIVIQAQPPAKPRRAVNHADGLRVPKRATPRRSVGRS
jgi:hypothetical protein